MAAGEEQFGNKDSFGLYLDEIARTPLLDAAGEVDLAKRIEAGLLAERVIEARKSDDLPTYLTQLKADIAQKKDSARQSEHQKAIAHTKTIKQVIGRLALDKNLMDSELEFLAADGQEAYQDFLKSNLRLVVSIARKYTRSGMPILDLVQEGNTGLIRAVEKFDYTKGYKFSTYATWWVRQAVTRGIAQSGRIVRLPVHVVEELNQVNAVKRALTLEFGREPEPKEIAKELEMDIDRVIDLQSWGRDHLSLDTPMDDDGQLTLQDLLPEQHIVAAEEVVLGQEVHERLTALLEVLDERSADIIRGRHGLLDGRQQKLAEVGARHNISAERARQLEREAMIKLRQLADPDLADGRSA